MFRNIIILLFAGMLASGFAKPAPINLPDQYSSESIADDYADAKLAEKEDSNKLKCPCPTEN